MEAKLSSFLNEIKDYISMDKINKFRKTIIQFEKENNVKLSIQWDEAITSTGAEIIVKTKKVPKDLEKRLYELLDVEEVKFKINEENSDEEIVETCMKIFNYLEDIGKRNKGYYFNLGYLLSILKSRSNTEKEFLAYAKEKFNRSKTIINDYIRFYIICNSYSILMSCNLSYREIMKNLPEIKTIIDQRTDVVG